MVVGPGSVTNGYRRRLVAGDLGKLLPAPDWLIPLLGEPERPRWRPDQPEVTWATWYAELQLRAACRALAPMVEGGSRAGRHDPGRNRALYNEAFRLRPALPALGYEQIEADLLVACEANGLPEGMAKGTIKSALLSPLKGPQLDGPANNQCNWKKVEHA